MVITRIASPVATVQFASAVFENHDPLDGYLPRDNSRTMGQPTG
ncbi:hypothetical protein AC519_5003 [Pseudomonas savastanoi]|nr:hypothetical protein AC519_5003 [Pseudomonas savastanoi]